MKAIAIMAGAAALMALPGCGQTGGSDSASRDAKAGTPAARQQAGARGTQARGNGGLASAGAGEQQQRGLAGNPNVIQTSSSLTPAVDRAFLIGRWTDTRDCDAAGEFTADGRYTNADGVAAQWTLEGDRLTMTFGGGAPRTIRVSAVDQNTLEVVNPDGRGARSTRCRAA